MNVMYTKQKTQKNKKWIDALLLIKNQTIYLKDINTQKILESFQYEEKNINDDLITTQQFLIQLQDELQLSKIKLSRQIQASIPNLQVIQPEIVSNTQSNLATDDNLICIEPKQKDQDTTFYEDVYQVHIGNAVRFITNNVYIIIPANIKEQQKYMALLCKYNSFDCVKDLNSLFFNNLQQISCELIYSILENLKQQQFIKGQFYYYPKNKYQQQNALDSKIKLKVTESFTFSRNDLIIIVINNSQFEQQLHLFTIDQYQQQSNDEIFIINFGKLDIKIFDKYNENGTTLQFIILNKFQLMLQYFNQIQSIISTQSFNSCSMNFLKSILQIYNKKASALISIQDFDYQIPDFTIPPISKLMMNKFQYATFETILNSYINQTDDTTLFLIRGVFGSGKSQTIVNLVNHLYYLFGQDFKILITSITNTAIDNILQRVQNLEIPHNLIQRLGSNLANKQLNEFQREQFNPNTFLTFVTCSSIGKCKAQQFDLVIVDEASQMKEYEYLYIASLVNSHKIILCGDPAQLPPVSQIDIMKISIFQKFIESGQQLISLWAQYRCNKHISSISSQLFYGGNVITENDQFQTILTQKFCDYMFEKEDHDKMVSNYKENDKIKIIHQFKSQLGIFPPVMTITTRSCDEKYNNSRINYIEADQIVIFVKQLLTTNQFMTNQIGIITPYRAQSDLLKSKLPEGILISTVDSFQGDERQLIIFSHVKTDQDVVESFVESGCRVNVALSRAQYSFVLFKGNTSTKGYWGSIYKYCIKNLWSFDSISKFSEFQQRFSIQAVQEIYHTLDQPLFQIGSAHVNKDNNSNSQHIQKIQQETQKAKSKFIKVLKFQKEDPDKQNWQNWNKITEQGTPIKQIATIQDCINQINTHRVEYTLNSSTKIYHEVLDSLIMYNKNHL